MKLFTLFFLVIVVFSYSEKVLSDSDAFRIERLCTQDDNWRVDNILRVNEIDINADAINELLLLIQYNNNARFHLFYQAECGFAEVMDTSGVPVNFLSYSSSMACQPIGCREVAFCVDKGGRRYLTHVSGRHTLTNEQVYMWKIGKLPDDQVTSEININKYRFIKGTLINVENRKVSDVLENQEYFNPDTFGSSVNVSTGGFVASTCK